MLSHFLVPIEHCRGRVITTINSLRQLKGKAYKHQRPARVTGQALSLAVRLGEIVSNCARVLFLCGGVCTSGPGAILGQEYTEQMRSIKDELPERSSEARLFYKFEG